MRTALLNKLFSSRSTHNVTMHVITISDVAYNKIMEQKKGRESISTTIIRLSKTSEIMSESGWDAEKLDTDLNESVKKSQRRYSHDEVFR